jgi:membrane protease YdiL (CAAX protease family)
MPEPPPADSHVVRLAVIFEAGLVVLAIAAGRLPERSLWEQLSCRPTDVGYGIAACIPMLATLELMLRYPLGPLRRLVEISQNLIAPMFRDCTLAQLALISALAGIGEELLFRGVAQQALGERIGQTAGVLIISLAFGLLHAVTATYALLATLVGVYLGAICLLTGNLAAAILAHAIYDFVALWRLTRRPV